MSETEKETSVDVMSNLATNPESSEGSGEKEGEHVGGCEDGVGGEGDGGDGGGGVEEKKEGREVVELTVVIGGGEDGVGGEGGVAGEGGEGGEGEEYGTEERIYLSSIAKDSQGDRTHPFLPGLPVVATVTCIDAPRRRGPHFKIVLEHGPFTWTLHKYYRDFVSLRRNLYPMRMRLRRRARRRLHQRGGYLPHLLSVEDINPRLGIRLRNQLPKVQRFMNAVIKDGQLCRHENALKFLEVSRLSFVEDMGSKRKEGPITKRSGGHRRVTNCLGCTACCVCRCSVWKQRWFVLKDSCVVYVKSDRHTIGGVLLFDEAMTVEAGIRSTHLQHGLKITTQSRELLVKCPTYRSKREWGEALQQVMETTGKVWVEKKRFGSFAPVRENSIVKWFVDAEKYMATIASALLAAKDEIFITDWMMSPHIFLQRDEPHSLEWRLDKILLKKADEGVRVYIQLYKEILVAIDLGSEYVQQILKHPNIVLFRHPEHIQAGVYLWAHHEKILVIDQTLAFVGGIDLAFGRWDNARHLLTDVGQAPQAHITHLAMAAVSALGHTSPTGDTGGVAYQKWVGKDYYNPFIKDFIELQEPLNDQLDRNTDPRMPWHDIAACVYGAPARDVARHFIQRYNFTKREQAKVDDPYLLPRQAFTEKELLETRYLLEKIPVPTSSNATVQILRSVSEWSAGIPTEQSILTAYINAIKNAEHFIYIENQFFISSLSADNVSNGIADALRLRIARAHREGKKFRVIIVMPLLPSFEGEFGERSGTVLEAVIHWNYRSISRGKESLYAKLQEDGIDSSEIRNYVSVYGLRTHDMLSEKPVTAIVYVHSKCMIVDDRLTIIGSANVNDRSMLGDRDSEVAILVQDNDMIDGRMNGEPYKVGKFSHSLRCHIFKEHLGLLDKKCQPNDIDVQDPVCDEFYQTWMKSAEKNIDLHDEVFGGRSLPSDKVLNYQHLKTHKENPGVVDLEKAKELLVQMQGTIVPMPLRFLEEEDLLPDAFTKEALAPQLTFT